MIYMGLCPLAPIYQYEWKWFDSDNRSDVDSQPQPQCTDMNVTGRYLFVGDSHFRRWWETLSTMYNCKHTRQAHSNILCNSLTDTCGNDDNACVLQFCYLKFTAAGYESVSMQLSHDILAMYRFDMIFINLGSWPAAEMCHMSGMHGCYGICSFNPWWRWCHGQAIVVTKCTLVN